jgi:hypothetical protein
MGKINQRITSKKKKEAKAKKEDGRERFGLDRTRDPSHDKMSPRGTFFSDRCILFNCRHTNVQEGAANSLPGPYEGAESITGTPKQKKCLEVDISETVDGRTLGISQFA